MLIFLNILLQFFQSLQIHLKILRKYINKINYFVIKVMSRYIQSNLSHIYFEINYIMIMFVTNQKKPYNRGSSLVKTLPKAAGAT